MEGQLLGFEWEMTPTVTYGVWLSVSHEGEVAYDGMVGDREEGERIVLNLIKNLHTIKD